MEKRKEKGKEKKKKKKGETRNEYANTVLPAANFDCSEASEREATIGQVNRGWEQRR